MSHVDMEDRLLICVLPSLMVSFSRMLSVHSRYGLHARQVAYGDPLHRRLRQIRHLLCRSDCYRLERLVAGRV